jgi:hypothetical protein
MVDGGDDRLDGAMEELSGLKYPATEAVKSKIEPNWNF